MTVRGARILITGASGFIGSALTAALASEDCEIVRVGRVSSMQPDRTDGTRPDVAGDLGDTAFWRAILPRADVVFHLAAQTSVTYAEAFPRADWNANVLPMLCLLEASRENARPPMIVFAGSATEVGMPAATPIDESLPDRPITIYDSHKLAAERYLEHYAQAGWAAGVTLRFTNVYGPGPASSRPDRGILNQMMRRALAEEPLTLYGEGRQRRDYVFIDDAVAALCAAASARDTVSGRHFLVCSGQSLTLADAFDLVADRAAALTGRRVPVQNVPPPAGLSPIEDRSFDGDPARFREATGWEARTDLRAGIDATLQSFRATLGARA
jgi:UDP-glucose 4-epimerase